MSAKQHLVLSALGPDRTGLVAQIAKHITSRGGNVEDSRMAIFGAEFGVMMLISGEGDELVAIERELPSLAQATGLQLLARRTEERRRQGGLPCIVEASSLDQEGIVQSVAAALHDLGVNVVSLETSAYAASMSGAPLFRLEAHVEVPRSVGLSTLREKMAAVARQLDLDLDIRPAT